MRTEQDEMTVYLPDGRVLKGVRDYVMLADGGIWRRVGQRVGRPTEWRWTLDGAAVDQQTAEALWCKAAAKHEQAGRVTPLRAVQEEGA